MEISLQEREMMAYSAGIKAALQSARLVVDEQGRLSIWALDGDEDVFKILDQSAFPSDDVARVEVYCFLKDGSKTAGFLDATK